MMNSNKFVVVMGSPRKKGNSATLARQLIAGAEAKRATIEEFYLHDMDIRPCTACDACRKNTSDNCMFYDDDMQFLYPKLRQANVIVIASPIYWFTVSAQTKLFMDRCYALFGPNGEKVLAMKRIGIILTYEDSDPFTSGAVNAIRTFQDTFNYIGSKIVGMVYGRASKVGEIKNNKDLMEKAYQLGEKLASDV